MSIVGEPVSAEPSHQHYLIRGGIAGRERLRLLARVFRSTTNALFDRVGVAAGMVCLDAGCGGGDVSVELARRVGPRGRVIGTDIDSVKLDLARTEAVAAGIDDVTFLDGDLVAGADDASVDLVYARFLLTHLPDPGAALAEFARVLRPGGRIVVEDIDYSGVFAYPESPALRRSAALYTGAAIRRGGDPMIGPRLPWLLGEAGFGGRGVHVVQIAGLEGEHKIIHPLTLENMTEVIVADGLATPAELDEVIDALYDLARDPYVLVSLPRIVQAWGRRPAA